MSTLEPLDIHDQVHAFADGELSPEEADTFRVHLGTCAQCQAELEDILQLQALGGRLAETRQAEVPRPSVRTQQGGSHSLDAAPSRAFRPAWSRRRNLVAAVALTGSLAAVLALGVFRAPGLLGGEPGREALALAPTRSLEARLSWSGARALAAKNAPLAPSPRTTSAVSWAWPSQGTMPVFATPWRSPRRPTTA